MDSLALLKHSYTKNATDSDSDSDSISDQALGRLLQSLEHCTDLQSSSGYVSNSNTPGTLSESASPPFLSPEGVWRDTVVAQGLDANFSDSDAQDPLSKTASPSVPSPEGVGRDTAGAQTGTELDVSEPASPSVSRSKGVSRDRTIAQTDTDQDLSEFASPSLSSPEGARTNTSVARAGRTQDVDKSFSSSVLSLEGASRYTVIAQTGTDEGVSESASSSVSSPEGRDTRVASRTLKLAATIQPVAQGRDINMSSQSGRVVLNSSFLEPGPDSSGPGSKKDDFLVVLAPPSDDEENDVDKTSDGRGIGQPQLDASTEDDFVVMFADDRGDENDVTGPDKGDAPDVSGVGSDGAEPQSRGSSRIANGSRIVYSNRNLPSAQSSTRMEDGSRIAYGNSSGLTTLETRGDNLQSLSPLFNMYVPHEATKHRTVAASQSVAVSPTPVAVSHTAMAVSEGPVSTGAGDLTSLTPVSVMNSASPLFPLSQPQVSPSFVFPQESGDSAIGDFELGASANTDTEQPCSDISHNVPEDFEPADTSSSTFLSQVRFFAGRTWAARGGKATEPKRQKAIPVDLMDAGGSKGNIENSQTKHAGRKPRGGGRRGSGGRGRSPGVTKESKVANRAAFHPRIAFRPPRRGALAKRGRRGTSRGAGGRLKDRDPVQPEVDNTAYTKRTEKEEKTAASPRSTHDRPGSTHDRSPLNWWPSATNPRGFGRGKRKGPGRPPRRNRHALVRDINSLQPQTNASSVSRRGRPARRRGSAVGPLGRSGLRRRPNFSSENDSLTSDSDGKPGKEDTPDSDPPYVSRSRPVARRGRRGHVTLRRMLTRRTSDSSASNRRSNTSKEENKLRQADNTDILPPLSSPHTRSGSAIGSDNSLASSHSETRPSRRKTASGVDPDKPAKSSPAAGSGDSVRDISPVVKLVKMTDIDKKTVVSTPAGTKRKLARAGGSWDGSGSKRPRPGSKEMSVSRSSDSACVECSDVGISKPASEQDAASEKQEGLTRKIGDVMSYLFGENLVGQCPSGFTVNVKLEVEKKKEGGETSQAQSCSAGKGEHCCEHSRKAPEDCPCLQELSASQLASLLRSKVGQRRDMQMKTRATVMGTITHLIQELNST